MNSRNITRRSAVLTGLYAFFVIGALLNMFAAYLLPLQLLTPFVMAIVGIAALTLTYEMNLRTIGAAGGTVIFVFVCQALGVSAGFPFGDLAYTNQLGPKVLDVPVTVPVAWLGILIPAWVAADKVLRYRSAVVAAIIVTAFDAVMEFAADALDLWHWRGGLPTELNYISWFGVSYLAFAILEKYAKEKEPNPIVPHLLFAQLLYFALTDAGLRFLVVH
jgi:uncharacterized membrane protein